MRAIRLSIHPNAYAQAGDGARDSDGPPRLSSELSRTRRERARRPGNESERLNFFPDVPDSFPGARVSRMTAREAARSLGTYPGRRVSWITVRIAIRGLGLLG